MKSSTYPSDHWLLLLRSTPEHLWPERGRRLEALVLGGLPEPEAEMALRGLEQGDHPHRDGGWAQSGPADTAQILCDLEEYPHSAEPHGGRPREEAARRIADKLGLDLDVALEVLEGLEASGWSAPGHDATPRRERL